MKFKLDSPTSIISLIVVLAILLIGLYCFSAVVKNLPTSTNTSSNITDETLQNISQVLGQFRLMFDILIIFVGIAFALWLLTKHSAFKHETEETRTVIKTTIPLPKKPEDTTFPKPLVPLSTTYPRENGDYILFTETSNSLSKEITTVQESLGLWTQTVPVDDKNVVIYISKWTKKDTHIHGGISPLWKPIQIKK